MHARKKVTVICHGPIAIGKQYHSPWEDVFVRYKTGPNKTHYKWLTLNSFCSIERDLDFEISFLAEHPEYDDDELNELIELFDETQECGIHFEPGNDTNISTSDDWITRKTAEKMIRVFFARHGFNRVSLNWKYPDVVVVPV